MPEPIAYKVLTADQLVTIETGEPWAGAQVDVADGFVHLSTADQLVDTIDKHFAGQTDLQIATVDLDAYGDAVRWEPSRGGQLFPHLYASLTLDALLAYGPLEREEDGSIRLPVTG